MHRMFRARTLLALALAALCAAVPARVAGPAAAQSESAGPRIASAVGTSRTRVRLRFDGPGAQGLAARDLVLTMGGEPRAVTRVKPSADGETAIVVAKPAWPYGTAGAVRLRTADQPVRVWATPGDVTRPVLRNVRLEERVVCVQSHSRDCARNGGTVRYVVDEPVSIVLDLRHRSTDAPSLLKVSRGAGPGSVRFGSKIEGRRLRPGSFRLTVTAIDPAGNESRPVTLSLRVRD